MRATATCKGKYEHEIRVREHRLTADEPEDIGGKDVGPSPEELLAASLASCTAITMQMYADRKGWTSPAWRSTATTSRRSGAARRSSSSSCACPSPSRTTRWSASP